MQCVLKEGLQFIDGEQYETNQSKHDRDFRSGKAS